MPGRDRTFARYGYDGVTMRQLAEALGCSPKTPYRYFRTGPTFCRPYAPGVRQIRQTRSRRAGAANPIDRMRRVGEAITSSPPTIRTTIGSCSNRSADRRAAMPTWYESDRARRLITSRSEALAAAGLIADPKSSAGRCGRYRRRLVMCGCWSMPPANGRG